MARPTACANIKAAGQKRRALFGLAALAVATGLAFFVAPAGGIARWAAEGLLLGYGWLGLIQAMEKTCVMLASSGMQETDSGKAAISDEALVAALKARARTIWIKAFLAAAVSLVAFSFVNRA